MRWLSFLLLCVIAPWPTLLVAQSPQHLDRGGHAISGRETALPLVARIVAVGVHGAGAVTPVGFFHPGGPIHDKPEFAAFTQPGRGLDATRILVSSTSNFGAPRVRADIAEGSVLSLDPAGDTIVVPADFAALGNQASARDGRIQLFTAQSAAFFNSVRTPDAASAAFPAASNPLGISINNAFGRVWIANAPSGTDGAGTVSIVDPSGEPLAGAPNKAAGGVFVGGLTNRLQQIMPGALSTGAVATALLGASPDGSKRAVFAVLTADGALTQVHTELGLDGMAPIGTIAPIQIPSPVDANANQAPVTRVGMIFGWVPDRLLFVTEPGRNSIAVLALSNDDKLFKAARINTLMPAGLDIPIDMAPAVPEVANPGFSSNTTLAGNSDIYVANRGNGTVVRMKQDGTVVAIRRVVLPGGEPIGPNQLNGIAVSPDAQTIWLTVSGAAPEYPRAPGVVLEAPAFAPDRSAASAPPAANSIPDSQAELIERGAELFRNVFNPSDGLGPLFNGRSCFECHQSPTSGGMGVNGLATISRVGSVHDHVFQSIGGKGSPVARAHTIASLGEACDLIAGPPSAANLISVRNAPALYGLGLIETIPDAEILAGAVPRGSVKGRANMVHDWQGNERVGRYGWKADIATLDQMVGEAFRNELGMTNPRATADPVAVGSNCGRAHREVDITGMGILAVSAYIASLPVPDVQSGPEQRAGRELFATTGCAACHKPALAANGIKVPLYSDLLLHDMGPVLDDGVVQGMAAGGDWRTTPLWGLGSRARFLHDGRATSVKDAVLTHGGEAEASMLAFRALSDADRAALLAFLSQL